MVLYSDIAQDRVLVKSHLLRKLVVVLVEAAKTFHGRVEEGLKRLRPQLYVGDESPTSDTDQGEPRRKPAVHVFFRTFRWIAL